MKNKKAIWRLHISIKRQGDLKGVFIATEEEVEALIESKIEIYWGEVLGKHSEVYGPLQPRDVTFITANEDVISIIEDYELTNGHDPFQEHTVEGDSIYSLVEEIIKNKEEK